MYSIKPPNTAETKTVREFSILCIFFLLLFLQVYNYLPTISSVIGGFTPQRYVWRICIALHTPQRLMVAVGYYSYHTSVHVGTRNELYKTFAAVNSLLHFVEILSLLFLSMISSTENSSE